MNAVGLASSPLLDRARTIAKAVAGPHANEVDRDTRFPSEAIDAAREEGLLSALVPRELGGAGATINDVARLTQVFGTCCSSTALIFAMHQAQVACLVRHGDTDLLRDFLAELIDSQFLLASAASDVHIDGDVNTSGCAIERSGSWFTLEKQASVISYGVHADAILATARRTSSPAPEDRVLVLCRPPGLVLEQRSEWDTLGFRGTCSPEFDLTAEGDAEQIFPAPFSEISAVTMVPVSYVLWSAAWLGIATAAVERAQLFLRDEAEERAAMTVITAIRLAELTAVHQQMTELIDGVARQVDAASDDPTRLAEVRFAIAMNNLKTTASTLLIEIVSHALTICGMDGYRLNTTHSMSRLLRDACGATLMVNNDCTTARSAEMLMMSKES